MRHLLPFASPPFGSLTLVWLAMILAACSSPTEAERLLARAERAEALWLETRPVEYEARQSRICECLPAATGPVRLQVTRSAGSEAPTDTETLMGGTYTQSGEPVPAQFLQHFLTAQELFDLVREGVEERAFSVEATFDQELGYPRSVSVDWDEQIADEESIYQMELVEP